MKTLLFAQRGKHQNFFFSLLSVSYIMFMLYCSSRVEGVCILNIAYFLILLVRKYLQIVLCSFSVLSVLHRATSFWSKLYFLFFYEKSISIKFSRFLFKQESCFLPFLLSVASLLMYIQSLLPFRSPSFFFPENYVMIINRKHSKW